MSSNADVFCRLFSSFDLIVRPKGDKSRNAATKEDLATVSSITRAQLKTLLKKAIEEYEHAKKLFKRSKIRKDELYEFEWRVFELREELDRLDNEGVL